MRSKERVRKLGEVFTPRKLCLEMLKRVPKDYWSDPTKTFLDPTCGDGAFLSCIIPLKIKSGLSPIQALSTTFGVDIMQDNIDDCRERLLSEAEKASGLKRSDEWIKLVNKNIVCHDSLTYDFEFKEQT